MKLHPHLLVVVAETMLSIDRLIELPVWLIDMLKVHSYIEFVLCCSFQGIVFAPSQDPL